MGQSQHPGGWPLEDADVECIDLTSSPDPPPKPQPQLRRLPQQQLHSYVKREPKEMAAGSVHPDHVRRIIDSSDPTAIRHVLLNLCTISTALSGAVARGLAPFSAFAQETIRDYRKKADAPNIKSDPGEAAKPTYQDVKKAYRATPSPQPCIKRETKAISILTDDEEDLTEPFSPSPRPHAASRPSLAGPSSLSSRASNTTAPSYASVKLEWPSSSRLPLRHITQGTPHTSNRVSTPSASVKTEPRLRGQKCKYCRERFENENGVCVYHPGRKLVITNDDGERVSVYGCCREPVYEPGCMTGTHLADPAEDLIKPPRMTDRSPTVLVREPKKPRLL